MRTFSADEIRDVLVYCEVPSELQDQLVERYIGDEVEGLYKAWSDDDPLWEDHFYDLLEAENCFVLLYKAEPFNGGVVNQLDYLDRVHAIETSPRKFTKREIRGICDHLGIPKKLHDNFVAVFAGVFRGKVFVERCTGTKRADRIFQAMAEAFGDKTDPQPYRTLKRKAGKLYNAVLDNLEALRRQAAQAA
jgi:hypothetical protein